MDQLTKGGVDRRRVLQGTAWAAPAIVLAIGAPAAATSGGGSNPVGAAVVPVRHEGPLWESYTDQNKMPGFRFSSTQLATCQLVITKTGAAAQASEVLNPYDGMVFSGSNNTFVAIVDLTPSKTKGVTIKNTPKAVGTYTALVYYPQNATTPVATATFRVYADPSTGQLRVAPA